MKELLRKEYFLALLPTTVSVCMALMIFFEGYELDFQLLSSSIISALILFVLLNTSKEDGRQRHTLIALSLTFGTVLMGFTLILNSFISGRELSIVDMAILAIILPLGSLLNSNEIDKRFKGKRVKPFVGRLIGVYIIAALALLGFKLCVTGESLINEAGVITFNFNASLLYAISIFALSRVSAKCIEK